MIDADDQSKAHAGDEEGLPSWDDLLKMIEMKCPSVQTVTDADFQERVLGSEDRRRTVVVQFFARACPHCHQAAEVLEVVAKMGRDVVKVDCEAHNAQATVRRFAIGVFPSILLFRGGVLHSVFNHSRTPEKVDKWIAHFAGPVS